MGDGDWSRDITTDLGGCGATKCSATELFLLLIFPIFSSDVELFFLFFFSYFFLVAVEAANEGQTGIYSRICFAASEPSILAYRKHPCLVIGEIS
jgi:hypothetical protein